ncbi:hypothetical protein SAM40697_0482 [Streptomyces ambofaciens]|uniref:ABC transporter ATP-binding protein n=1 Tax=Streptomyces ambofaciens TaxID=1889 RepID=A0ABM7D7L7_STRAM|nr:hypothetical protein SAM40697_0482 [Streptomyces ambofaciens]
MLVAHRLTQAERADRILVLDDGTVVESGSHAELPAGGTPSCGGAGPGWTAPGREHVRPATMAFGPQLPPETRPSRDPSGG